VFNIPVKEQTFFLILSGPDRNLGLLVNPKSPLCQKTPKIDN
jgi:hypothetical protein